MSMFKLPKNIRATDMAIWIDENAYSEDCDDNKLYMYLCCLINMLAKTNRYFTNEQDYNDFAGQFGTQMYYRYRNPKQFELDDNGDYKLTKIKSSLNYLKSKIFYRMLEYKRDKFSEFTILNNDDQSEAQTVADTFNNFNISDSLSLKFRDIEFTDYLDSVPRIIYDTLRDIPYRSDGVLWRNIYLSCLLTILDQITLSKKDVIRLNKYINSNSEYKISLLYKQQTQNEPILYHLDKTFAQYVKVQVNKIKHRISLELSDIVKAYQPSDEVIKTFYFQQAKGDQSE